MLMSEIKDINGKGLQLNAEDIIVPALGKSLAAAIIDGDIPIPPAVAAQIKAIQDTHAFISNVKINIISGDTASGSATFENGVLTLSLVVLKGNDGDNGKSAYEVAVANGFEGTEDEWLESLKGKGGLDEDAIDTTDLSDTDAKVPSSKLVKSKLANVGTPTNAQVESAIASAIADGSISGCDPNISDESATVLDEEMVFVGDENLAKIGSYGIMVKALYDINGVPLQSRRIYFVDKSGRGRHDYTSLTECIFEATKYFDSVVYVNEGEYNLVDEFKAKFGNDFFDNFTTESVRGLILQNRIKVVFGVNTKVIFDYDGDNEVVNLWFAPFNSGVYGFELIGANIYSKNCRYSVHDERSTNIDTYLNIYRNCYMYHDSTEKANSKVQCIGGGLGLHGTVIVDNCHFDNATESAHYVSWHNSLLADAKSRLYISNCYFANKGIFRLGYYGKSTLISTAYINGNSFGGAIVKDQESDEYAVDNIEIKEWNNIIRN